MDPVSDSAYTFGRDGGVNPWYFELYITCANLALFIKSVSFWPNIMQKEKGTSLPTGRSNGPQLRKIEQSSPSGSLRKAGSSSKPSKESKCGFNSEFKSVPGSEV